MIAPPNATPSHNGKPVSGLTKPLIGLSCRWDQGKGQYFLPLEYAQALEAAGCLPVQIPLIPGMVPELAARLDGIVLTGSPSDVDPSRYGRQRAPEVEMIHAQRDETDWLLLDHAFALKKPVLGICFGLQLLNVYRG